MDYELMNKVSKQAAKWWADTLRKNLPGNICVDIFQKNLEMSIKWNLAYIGFAYLTVGEYPESLLALAAKESGIDYHALPKASLLVTTRTIEIQ